MLGLFYIILFVLYYSVFFQIYIFVHKVFCGNEYKDLILYCITGGVPVCSISSVLVSNVGLMSRRSSVRARYGAVRPKNVYKLFTAQMSEWSKEPDLRPGVYNAWVRTPFCAKNVDILYRISTHYLSIYLFNIKIYR